MKKTGYFFIVVTPSYNQADFISQTIDSVSSQKQPKHHIVMDGGSTDKTRDILKKKSTKIEWVSKKDDGQTDAINKGIIKAEKYVVKNKLDPNQVIFSYLNSDDYYLEGAFDKIAQAFAEYPEKHWLVGDAVIIDSKNVEIQKPIRAYKKLFRGILHINKIILGILNPIPQPATFYKFSAVKKIGSFNKALYYVMDYEYWLRLWQAFSKPIFISNAIATFRIHDQAKGEQGFEQQFEEQLQISKEFFKNPLVIWLQQLHNLVIVTIYKIIK